MSDKEPGATIAPADIPVTFNDIPVGSFFTWGNHPVGTKINPERCYIKSETQQGTIGYVCLGNGDAGRAFRHEMIQEVSKLTFDVWDQSHRRVQSWGIKK